MGRPKGGSGKCPDAGELDGRRDGGSSTRAEGPLAQKSHRTECGGHRSDSETTRGGKRGQNQNCRCSPRRERSQPGKRRRWRDPRRCTSGEGARGSERGGPIDGGASNGTERASASERDSRKSCDRPGDSKAAGAPEG